MKTIRPLELKDLQALKHFTDSTIGQNYYSLDELRSIFDRSNQNNIMCSFVLEEDDIIKGIRITFPPGQWTRGKGQGLTPQLWPHLESETAYFQSLFLDHQITGQGLGKQMSLKSIETLKQLGAKGIVCHSWKESPNDSSSRYLRGLNFIHVADHPKYWSQVDYLCTGCKTKPCQCTAEEMYLDIS